jgi:predicted Co/Zn/Cd cation transporter (cation efflux family)
MSLRAFHLFFIILSAMLAAFCAAWAVAHYRLDHTASYAAGAIVSVVCAGALAVYGAMFQRKTRNL